jgi:tetratricopeptide (TPR) repeat protein
MTSEKDEEAQRLEEANRHYNWGCDAVELELYEIAIDEYTVAIKLNPSYAEAYTNRGLAYRKLRRPTKATADLKAAARLGSTLARDDLLKNSRTNNILLGAVTAIVALIIISAWQDHNEKVNREEMQRQQVIAAEQAIIKAEQEQSAFLKEYMREKEKKRIHDMVYDHDDYPYHRSMSRHLINNPLSRRPLDDPIIRSGVGMKEIEDDVYKYRGLSGTKYKYDLSNPSDRIMYKVDPSAQIMDSVNPLVKMDRSMGQYGGGSK